jgi:hypothetical protein
LTLPFSPSHLFSFLLSSPSQYKFLAYIMLGIFGVVGGTFLITGGAVWYLFGREGDRECVGEGRALSDEAEEPRRSRRFGREKGEEERESFRS